MISPESSNQTHSPGQENINTQYSEADHAHALEMHRLIETKAYLLAEKDGFIHPCEDYWMEAEAEVKSSYQ